MSNQVYQRVYQIDMNKLNKMPIVEVTPGDGVELPILNPMPTTTPILFNAHYARIMKDQYDILFPKIQNYAAQIIEFVDSDGKPLLTIYPNKTMDFHKRQDDLFLAHIDLTNILKEYDRRLAGVQNLLHNRSGNQKTSG